MVVLVVSTTLCFLWQLVVVRGLAAQTCDPQKLASLDVDRLKATIQSGRAYHQSNFLSEQDVMHFLNEIDQLDEEFERSGLSNTAAQTQGFGQQDRRVCPVPWWKSMLDELRSFEEESSSQSSFHPAVHQINHLRSQFAKILNRPSMLDHNLAHECYYSVSTAGATLSRHMDERHEELKGPKGWLLPSRRSLSWLIYLTDDNWSLEENGGALRTFPQVGLAANDQIPSHEGNLQVGWLLESQKPVYLNSWFIPNGSDEPHNVLYTLLEENSVQLLSKAWLSETVHGLSVADFLSQEKSSLFLSGDGSDFVLLENRKLWDEDKPPEGSHVHDIAPTRGSLVVFDSVLLPHQVEAVKKGRRVALAGWFHEATQDMPMPMTGIEL